jgi:hypothetical protein
MSDVEPIVSNLSGKGRPNRHRKPSRQHASEIDKLLKSVFKGDSK